MTTEQATYLLSSHLCGTRIDESDKAEQHMIDAVAAGREWAWAAAGKHLDAAYRALGAEPPQATGADWHRGVHPIQIAAEKFLREIESL